MQKKKFVAIFATVVVFSLLFGGVVGNYLAAQSNTDEGVTYKIRLFMRIIKTVEENYVKKVKVEDLIDYAIKGMLNSLDPHTVYLDRNEYKELLIGTKGRFGGLGIQIGMRDGVLTIITPLEGTPAYNAGLLAGDKIMEIEGVSTKGITLQEAVNKLRGKPGTEVTIGIKREGVKDIIHFTIVRDIIKVKSIPFSGMLSKDIGYIRLATFSETSATEFASAIDSLEKEGARKFILDLRNNPGGLLREAIEISDNFLDKGKVIVSTKGRKIGTSRDYYAKTHPKYGNFPLIVLVNGGSASASEIVSSAIQDWDRGLILGTKTYGKGSVQQVIPVDHQTALKITTAIYYSPSGRTIDTEVKNKVLEPAFSLDTETKTEKDTTTYHTLRLKRKVHGCNAVTPDVIVELPRMTDLETKIYQKGLFFDFTVDYTTTHKLNKGFAVDNNILNSFKKYIKGKKLEFTDEDFEKSINDIKIGLERTISMKLWGIKGSYEATLKYDKQIQKAEEILSHINSTDELFTYVKEK